MNKSSLLYDAFTFILYCSINTIIIATIIHGAIEILLYVYNSGNNTPNIIAIAINK